MCGTVGLGYTLNVMNLLQNNKREKKGLDSAVSLIEWRFLEKKEVYSYDKVLLVLLLGLAASILSILVKTYILSALFFIATLILIWSGRRPQKKRVFAITSEGFFLDDDFLSLEEVQNFNIIDIPGERAHLILRVRRIVFVNEVVPIYDVDIEKIRSTLKKLGIIEDEDLEPGPLERLVSFI